MSTYHYDGSPCPESCTCAVREVDRLRAQLEAVTRERDERYDCRGGPGTTAPACGGCVTCLHRVIEATERERDEAQAVLRKCHEVAWPRGGDLNGDPVCDLMLMRGTFQAHITTLERERDEARADAARLREALQRENMAACKCGAEDYRMSTCPSCRRTAAALASTPSAEPTRTDAERWLGDGPEAPGGTLAFHAEPTPPKCPSPSCKACIGEACDKCGKGSWNPEGPECTHDVLQRHEAPSAEPDYSGLCYAPECGGHCGYVHARGCEAIREYLADHGGDPYKAPPRAPSAEPTPRDMRVAEAVREACVETADASDEASRRVAGDLRDLDLAAVVTEAVKP